MIPTTIIAVPTAQHHLTPDNVTGITPSGIKRSQHIGSLLSDTFDLVLISNDTLNKQTAAWIFHAMNHIFEQAPQVLLDTFSKPDSKDISYMYSLADNILTSCKEHGAQKVLLVGCGVTLPKLLSTIALRAARNIACEEYRSINFKKDNAVCLRLPSGDLEIL